MDKNIPLGLEALVSFIVIIPLLALLAAPAYRSYLRIRFGRAYGFAGLAVTAGLVLTIYVLNQTPGAQLRDIIPEPRRVSLGSFFFPVFLLPLVVKLYRSWIGGKVTAEERRPGVEGVRAWLGVGNSVCVLGMSLCGWMALGYSFWALLVLGLALLAAYPVMRSATAGEGPSSILPETDSGPSERDRVLRMLEEGKVKADEAAELLSALGEATPGKAAQPAVTWSGKQKLILIGALLVFAGFLLPWFSVNMAQEMQRALGQMAAEKNIPLPGFMGQSGGKNIKVSGSDLEYGQGWITLALALAAAGLNLVPNQLAASTRGLVTKLCLAAGGALLAYLVLDNLRHVSVGLLVVVVGYGMLVAGSWTSGVRVGAPARVGV